MTEIKSAIKVVNKYLTWSVMGSNYVSEEQAELENSLIFLRDYVEKTSKAWEEVLQELEEEQRYLGNTLFQRQTYEKAIDIINKHLAEIEE